MMSKRGWGAALAELDRAFDATSAGRDRGSAADAVLLDRFAQQRDEAAFATLVDRHGPMVLQTARGIVGSVDDAEDVCQATFLTLARHAGTVRSGASVAAWLHQVARRAAIRVVSRRRRQTNGPGAATSTASDPDHLAAPSSPDPGLAEASRLLQAEIDRLPAAFRQAVVLCDLEGLTRDEAASQLDWPAGTVASRLARGRRLLRERLTRRLGGAEVWLGAGPGTRSAPLPPPLPIPPALLARLVARLGATSSAVGPAAGVSGPLALALLTLVALGGIAAAQGRWVPRAAAPPPASRGSGALVSDRRPAATADIQTGPQPGRPLPDRSADRTAVPEDPVGGRLVVRGRVVDPEGRPVGGAEVALVGSVPSESGAGSNLTARTDSAGLFTLVEAGWGRAEVAPTLLATAPGFGPTLLRVQPNEGSEVRLDPRAGPVRGRVTWPSNEVPGPGPSTARFRPLALLEPRVAEPAATADLAPLDPSQLVAEWRVAVAGASLGAIVRTTPQPEPVGAGFVVTGLATTSVLLGVIEGPGLATQVVVIAPGRPLPGEANTDEAEPGTDSPRWLLAGGDFVHHAAPARPIRGTVRAEATGVPIAGATVAVVDALAALGLPTTIGATTDAFGQFTLEGLSPSDRIAVEVRPPGDAPDLGLARTLARRDQGGAGADAVFRLRRGAWATGRVVDLASARPRLARITAWNRPDEPAAQPGVPGDRLLANSTRTDDAGRFRLAVARGPGLLLATTGDPRDPVGVGLDRARADLLGTDGGDLATAPWPWDPGRTNAVVAIDPRTEAPGETTIAIASAAPITGVVVGPDGALARSGVVAWNLASNGPPVPVVEGRFEVVGLVPGRTRRVYFRHDGAGLVGSLEIAGGSAGRAGPVEVRLQPWASYELGVGDGSDHPIAGQLRVQVREAESAASASTSASTSTTAASALLDERRSEAPPIRDRLLADGRHELSGFDPGLTYDVRFESPSLGIIAILEEIRLGAGQREARGSYLVRADGISAL